MTPVEGNYVSAGHGGRYNPSENSFINGDNSNKKSQLRQVQDETIYGINETQYGLQIQDTSIERKNEAMHIRRTQKVTRNAESKQQFFKIKPRESRGNSS